MSDPVAPAITLYHFTSANALPAIAKHGLTIGDIPTDFVRWKGVIGIWFTTASTAVDLGLKGALVEKSRMRLRLDLSRLCLPLHRWDDWKGKNVTPQTIRGLERTAGPNANPATWYIYLGLLRPEKIVEVYDMKLCQTLTGWEDGLPGFEPIEGVAYRDRHAWHRQMLRDVRKVTSSMV